MRQLAEGFEEDVITGSESVEGKGGEMVWSDDPEGDGGDWEGRD